MLKKIAVTGGIASGKTTVCQFFKELGATVVFSDSIVHDLLKTLYKEKLVASFGPNILKNGEINRKTLAEITFKNPEKLKMLEELIHPAVLQRIDEEYSKAKGSCFVAEIPLLYEIGAQDSFDIVIAVISDEENAKKRFKQGDAEYELRMNRQLHPEEKAKRADHILTNNGTLEELKNQAKALYQKICKDT